MPSPTLSLQTVVYGEYLDSLSQRSLGYRLLEPATPPPWGREIDTLARHLQATPYPDYWPSVDLFCSVLLPAQQRLVAAARYGVQDHTSSHRRGGMELIGVIGPADLDTTSALRIYHWLRRRRAATEDLHTLGGMFSLEDILAQSPEDVSPPGAPVLPIRGWQAGCFVFAAPTPAAPDQHLGLLALTSSASWQWLPLCGSDFPFHTYAERGPLMAWSPDLADLALHLDRSAASSSLPTAGQRRNWLAGLLVLLLVLLLGGNLYALWSLPDRVAGGLPATPTPTSPPIGSPPQAQQPAPEPKEDSSREQFALALYQLLQAEGGANALTPPDPQLLARYQGLVKSNRQLQVGNPQAQAAVGLISRLARYNPEKIADLIRQEFKQDKILNQEFIKIISERVQERLTAEVSGH